MEERYKIDKLMAASYLESSFYNVFYKSNVNGASAAGGKKLRFQDGEADESNFGLEDPLEAVKPQFTLKNNLKKLQQKGEQSIIQ